MKCSERRLSLFCALLVSGKVEKEKKRKDKWKESVPLSLFLCWNDGTAVQCPFGNKAQLMSHSHVKWAHIHVHNIANHELVNQMLNVQSVKSQLCMQTHGRLHCMHIIIIYIKNKIRKEVSYSHQGCNVSDQTYSKNCKYYKILLQFKNVYFNRFIIYLWC